MKLLPFSVSLREALGMVMLVLGTSLLIAGPALASINANLAGSDGETSRLLATQLYCGARELIRGNVGLILGLVLVVAGLWSMVMGGGWVGGLITIILGAALPSLPGLVEGFMIGLGGLLAEANLSTRTFEPPTCGERRTPIPSVDDLMQRGSCTDGGISGCV